VELKKQGKMLFTFLESNYSTTKTKVNFLLFLYHNKIFWIGH